MTSQRRSGVKYQKWPRTLSASECLFIYMLFYWNIFSSLCSAKHQMCLNMYLIFYFSAWELMAAHRTVIKKNLKFGTIIRAGFKIFFAHFDASFSNLLVPLTVQIFTYIVVNKFWIKWCKNNRFFSPWFLVTLCSVIELKSLACWQNPSYSTCHDFVIGRIHQLVDCSTYWLNSNCTWCCLQLNFHLRLLKLWF